MDSGVAVFVFEIDLRSFGQEVLRQLEREEASAWGVLRDPQPRHDILLH